MRAGAGCAASPGGLAHPFDTLGTLMPVYDYLCDDCGVFDAMRRIAERDDAVQCPRCGADAQRVTVAAPALASGSGAESASASEGRYGGMRHVGCNCCP